MGLPLEDLNVSPEERDENITDQLKQSQESKRVLIVKVSHVGGHKYTGNCIVSASSVPELPGNLCDVISLLTDRSSFFLAAVIHPVRVWDLVRPGHTARRRLDCNEHHH